MADFTPWPHQMRTLSEVAAAIERGRRRICVTTPTGGGKSWTMGELLRHWGSYGWRGVLYTNRRLLIDQTIRNLDRSGIPHGIRAAGFPEQLDAPIQISSLPTEGERTLKQAKWTVHGAGSPECIAVVDEAHLNKGEVAREVMKRHHQYGHVVIGFTATPAGLDGLYEELIVAGTTSELRKCGALVPARVFGPDEPDFHAFKKKAKASKDDPDAEVVDGEVFDSPTVVKAMGGRAAIFGRVWEWFLKLNPQKRPTILFAPGVPESLWFAEEFTKRGVPAAHIDGSQVWFDGERMPSNAETRADIFARSNDGTCPVICNRFVLREGIDCPWLAHGILATVFGSADSYLQSVGRLLRAHPGLSHVTIQDHGGNWWRHGSPNADREWTLDFTPGMIAAERKDNLREGAVPEPARCRRCGQIVQARLPGELTITCPCGNVMDLARRSRPVSGTDGVLYELRGNIFRRRARTVQANTIKAWTRCYFRAKNSKRGMTFLQAEALFFQENRHWPPRTLHYFPKEPHDMYRLVSKVPPENLIGYKPKEAR